MYDVHTYKCNQVLFIFEIYLARGKLRLMNNNMKIAHRRSAAYKLMQIYKFLEHASHKENFCGPTNINSLII